MSTGGLQHIAIVGGGLASWTTAACLARALDGQGKRITVVDPGNEHQAVAAESGLANSVSFHRYLGLDERDLMHTTRATFKLGTLFENWWADDPGYFSPLGHHGAGVGFTAFHHYLTALQERGDSPNLDDYSLAATAARAGKFAHPDNQPGSILSTMIYGLHMDGEWYLRYLRGYAMHFEVQHVQAGVDAVDLDPENGSVQALRLADGSSLSADLYVDCSSNGAVSRQGMGIEFEDWSHWLPANRAFQASSDAPQAPRALTQVTAMNQGWLRQFPLADRLVSEFIYNDQQIDEGDVVAQLSAKLEGEVNIELAPRTLQNGRIKSFWKQNCVALGAAAGGLEPLAVGELQLVHTGALRLAGLLPVNGSDPLLSGEYNRLTDLEYANLRDYTLAHYLPGGDWKSPLGQALGAEDIPESLARRMMTFQSQGQLPFYDVETYDNDQWASLLVGRGLWPQAYNRGLDGLDWERLVERFDQMREAVTQTSGRLPTHGDYLQQYRRAAPRQQ